MRAILIIILIIIYGVAMLTSSRTFTLSGLTLTALTLSACSAGTAEPRNAAASSAAATPAAASPSEEATGARQEVASLTPRAVLTYDGGLMTVDAGSGEVVATTEHEGFLRLNNAGDGRHVLVTTEDGFQVLITQGPEAAIEVATIGEAEQQE